MDTNHQETFEKLSNEAVEFAKKQDIDLDYTHESVQKVEQLLSMLYEEVQASETPTEDEYTHFANMFGAYLGNTLIKTLGKGKWEKGSGDAIKDAWAVTIDEHQYLFPSKVYRRLKNGPEDNVVQLYVHAFKNHSDEKLDLKIFPESS